VNGPWLTVAQVAYEFGFSPRTVLRWVDSGELPALRTPGGRLRISQSALDSWAATRMTVRTSPTLAASDEEVTDAAP
jgi:excisionase family DNA binding protein